MSSSPASPGLGKGLGLVLVAFLMFAPGRAGAQEEPAIEKLLYVQIRFTGKAVELLSVERGEGPVPVFYGLAQEAPLFFEASGAGGEVMVAGTLIDPREALTEDTTGPREEGVTRLVLPALDGLAEISVIQRVSDDLETGRKVLLKAELK